MKIARIFMGDIYNRKGKFNNVIERIKHLQQVNEVKSDIYIIQYKYTWSFRWFQSVPKKNEDKSATIDGIKLNILWVKFSLFEYLLTYKLRLKDIACKKQMNKYVDVFKNYNILATHDLLSSFLASSVKKKYKTPFVVTWHGSDINKYPFRSKVTFNTIKFLLGYADYNFFVSKALMKNSDKITKIDKKSHLYSGPADNFFRKPNEEIDWLNKKSQITSKNVVGFIGNLESIKNVLTLPKIFKSIQNKVEDITFVIIGDGRQKQQLRESIKSQGISNIIFTGKVEPEKIPNYLNTFDVLLLPSLNEGMPMVILEAQACGVHVVGSDVGGIPEAIGKENCFSLNQDFEKSVAERTIDLLTQNITPRKLPDEFSWNKTLEKEMEVYRNVLKD
ncbi:glycosyltransferase [Psychroflexus sp. MBR-150]|jgi:glycosyltransferase involved in cell wall biosynthesis